ncbi:hypothetical protein PG995_007494 [Apiospora arundinis]
MFINTTVNNSPPKTASMAFPNGVAAAKGLNPCSQPFYPAAATFSALSLNNDVRGAATTQNLGNSTATPFKLPAAITNSAAPAAHVNPFSVKPPPPPPTNPFLLKPPSTDGNPLFHPSSVAVSPHNEESSSGSSKPYTQSHRPRPQGGQHNPNRSTALYPQSYRPRPPRRQQKRQNKNQGGNKVSYPDYYSPARDKVNLCKGLRRNALSPEKLNSVLDCLEDVDRLQDQLIHARRELSNMALFGLKNGRNRGGSVSPERLTRKQRSGQATPILAPLSGSAGSSSDNHPGSGSGSGVMEGISRRAWLGQKRARGSRGRGRGRQQQQQAGKAVFSDKENSPEIKIESDLSEEIERAPPDPPDGEQGRR